MPPSKKEIEAIYVDRFKSAFLGFPDGPIEPTEEPDFLVRSSNSIIGVELTELHRASPKDAIPEQAREAMRHRVVRRAQELFEAQCKTAVRATVFMNDRVHIKKDEVEHLARAIADIAIRNLPTPDSSCEESYDWTNREYFPELIHAISVHRLDGLTKTFFACPGASWVATLSSDDIRRVLLSKESKCITYRKRCDEVWLLINADIGPMSTWFEFDATTMKHDEIFETDFNRVFLLRHFGNKLHELKLRRRKASNLLPTT